MITQAARTQGTTSILGAMYRGRLAPSPTGRLHLGVARTSLVAWLRARSAGGQLVMRVEDLDGPRVVAGSAASIQQDLHWLGLDWDEGPHLQSQRFDRYAAAIVTLRSTGLVYPCTCSRKEIASVASAPHEGDLEQRYPGTCRNGVSHDDGRTPSLRFRMSAHEPDFVDVLHGAQQGREGTDFVLQRADGVYAYQLAVVVDDIAMGITEIVRGDDLLSSTPRQVALYRALGATVPSVLHVPLLLDEQGRRLAKRSHSITIDELRADGYSAERIIGHLAFTLGLIDRDQSVAANELVAPFDLARVTRTPTRIILPIAR